MDNSNTHEIIDRLRAEIIRSLAPCLPKGARFALVDFPNHGNVGDSAIWLGEIAYFRNVHNATPAYVCGLGSFVADELRKALPEGPVFLHGGGNFGDLWPHHQQFRETVLRTLPDRPIIQLPQSLHFQNPDALKRAAAIVNAHPDFTLFVRDRESLSIAEENFSCKMFLCPDMALCLGRLDRPVRPTRPVLFLLRTDKEKRVEHLPDLAYPCEDWRDEDPDLRTKIRARTIRELFPALGTRALSKFARRELLYRRLAENRLDRGVRQLSSAEFIVSDRLHVHIVSLLLDLPHVILDNSYGKIGNFAQAWTKDSTIVQAADSLSEAMSLYRKKAASPSPIMGAAAPSFEQEGESVLTATS